MNFLRFYLCFVVVFAATSLASAGDSPKFDTKAKQAYMVDYNSGAVLLSKNAEQRMAPSSMTKLMTAYVVMLRIKQHDLEETDLFHVSERAYKMGGSRMFLEIGSNATIRDLMLGTVVVSGNDASVALAEGVSGSEQAFASEMNQAAGRMGMKGTNFVNASGWPASDHYSTAADLAILAKRTIKDFPKLYKKYYTVEKFTHNKISQPNRLPLLGREGYGVDGLKTGSSDDGGYGATLSAQKKDQRIILVFNGTKTKKERFEEARSLVTWAFTQFRTLKVTTAGKVLDSFDVWLGAKPRVTIMAEKDVFFTLAKRDVPDLKAEIRVRSPIPAPIKKGAEVGRLVVKGSSVQNEINVPLYAAEDIDSIGFFGKISHAVRYLIFGHSE